MRAACVVKSKSSVPPWELARQAASSEEVVLVLIRTEIGRPDQGAREASSIGPFDLLFESILVIV